LKVIHRRFHRAFFSLAILWPLAATVRRAAMPRLCARIQARPLAALRISFVLAGQIMGLLDKKVWGMVLGKACRPVNH
jgi:hypothetical protein